MSNYTHEAVIITPIALYETASKLGRAFDPDVGGDRNFDLFLGNPKSHCCCYVRLTTETAEQFSFLLEDGGKPEHLHAMVVADYESRWQEHEPPTLAECTEWLAQSKVYVHALGEDSFENIIATESLTVQLQNEWGI